MWEACSPEQEAVNQGYLFPSPHHSMETGCWWLDKIFQGTLEGTCPSPPDDPER